MRFNIRSCTSLLLTLSFVFMSISGIVLYIVPPGRVANWTNWTFVGLTKAQWAEIHTIFSLMFMIAGIIHVVYNWNVLIAYLKDRIRKSFRLKTELVAAVGISLICWFGSVYHIPPFGTIMDIGESVKLSWEDAADEAPVPHTELKTLREVADELGMQPDRVVLKLQHFGIEDVELDDTLADIAQKNGTSPSEVYKFIQQRGVGIKEAH